MLLQSAGAQRLADINMRQTAAWSPSLALCGDRPVAMGGLGMSQDGSRLSRAKRRTETYGLVRRRWEHGSAAPYFTVTSLAWRAQTGTPSEVAGTEARCLEMAVSA